MMRPKFSTLEWSKKNNGALTPAERLHFLRNMAFLAAREASDAIRDKLGLLKPVDLNVSDFAPPDTRMAKDAEVFARETHTQDLLSHGYRTYYFGAILASYSELKYDKELFFTAALLHDIGLTDSRAVPLLNRLFEFDNKPQTGNETDRRNHGSGGLATVKHGTQTLAMQQRRLIPSICWTRDRRCFRATGLQHRCQT